MNISKEDMAKFDKLPSSTNKKTVTVKNLAAAITTKTPVRYQKEFFHEIDN